MGATGSGKTLTLRTLLKSVLQGAGRPKALVYDPKTEFFSELSRLAGKGKTVCLNPLDSRCHCWDVAKDVTDPMAARQLAYNLVPPEGDSGSGSERFFDNAVRDLLTTVAITFVRATGNPGAWTFRDLILALLYEPYLYFVLGISKDRDQRSLPMNARVRRAYLEGDYRLRSNVMASVQAQLGIFEPVAAIWQEAWEQERRFSLTQWIGKGEFDLGTDEIVVLGNDETSRGSIDRVNQAVFQRMAELLLARPARSQWDPSDRVWLFLDEVREAGKLDALRALMNKSRAAGVNVVLSFQDIDGLRDVYGEVVANEIVAQCSNHCLLRLNSPTTAEWASDLFGSVLRKEENPGFNSGEKVPTFNLSIDMQERRNLLPNEILFAPPNGPAHGLGGYFKCSSIDRLKGRLYHHVSWSNLNSYLPHDGSQPNHLRHKNLDKFSLEVWKPDDWKRLGFLGDPPSHEKMPLFAD